MKRAVCDYQGNLDHGHLLVLFMPTLLRRTGFLEQTSNHRLENMDSSFGDLPDPEMKFLIYRNQERDY